MGAITGAQTNAVFVLNGTGDSYGTEGAAGAGDKIRCTVSPNFEAQRLEKSPIGSGLSMLDDVIKGRVTPRITIAGDLGYQNGFDKVLAQFFGTVTNVGEQTTDQDDYLHRYIFNPTRNVVFGSFAYETSSTTAISLPSCVVSSFTISFDQVSSIIQASAELLGNTVDLTPVNNNAAIQAATIADSTVAVIKDEDTFWINTQSGDALDSGDQLDITSLNFTAGQPQDFRGEVKGSAGNGEPVVDQLFAGTLVVTLKQNSDHTWYNAWDAETAYKARLDTEGEVIGTGDNKAIGLCFPRLKLNAAPVYNITEAGFNTVTLNFDCYVAAANPTGMESPYPYVEITNTRSANYIGA